MAYLIFNWTDDNLKVSFWLHRLFANDYLFYWIICWFSLNRFRLAADPSRPNATMSTCVAQNVGFVLFRFFRFVVQPTELLFRFYYNNSVYYNEIVASIFADTFLMQTKIWNKFFDAFWIALCFLSANRSLKKLQLKFRAYFRYIHTNVDVTILNANGRIRCISRNEFSANRLT